MGLARATFFSFFILCPPPPLPQPTPLPWPWPSPERLFLLCVCPFDMQQSCGKTPWASAVQKTCKFYSSSFELDARSVARSFRFQCIYQTYVRNISNTIFSQFNYFLNDCPCHSCRHNFWLDSSRRPLTCWSDVKATQACDVTFAKHI